MNFNNNPYHEDPYATQQLDGWFDDLRETVKDVWTYAQEELGVPVPFDQEILALRKGRDKIKANMARSTSVIQKIIPSIHNAKASGMSGPRTASLLKQEGGLAYSKGGATVQYFARAILAAQAAQASLRLAKPDPKIMADFFAKKKLAEMEGDATNARFYKFFSNVDEAWRTIVQGDSLTQALVQLPGEVARGFKRAVVPYIPTAMQATQIAKALPFVIGGILLLQLMPTIRRMRR